ncbi:MAG: succinyl-diaminopimelate desuccinylase [Hyphomicrobiales bacterium]|nr:succinyl-diaminopimelate desuccinylase [Hyphomicrobiales bacterium]
MALDPVVLAQDLIRCPSVTPVDAGALDCLQGVLEDLGFTCARLVFSDDDTPDVDNLYARIGTQSPNFCFAGHTDVVPAGDTAAWSVDPFAAEVRDGRLIGRGAADMKGAIAAFAAAAAGFLDDRGGAGGAAGDADFGGSISLLITGDEEGPSVNGTRKVLDWMRDRGETIDACVVGEPSNPTTLGEMAKIGRRGSMYADLTVRGIQGHSAYPERADNPLPRLVRMLAAIEGDTLDQGSDHFPPSTVTLTTVDVGNPAGNVIPAQGFARYNIRFNDLHTGRGVADWVRAHCDAVGGDYDLAIRISGESFLTPPGPLSDLVVAAVAAETGRTPALSTTGGTSDARFIKDFCPVIEFGMNSDMAHKVDESVAVDELRALARVYRRVLDGFFAAGGA